MSLKQINCTRNSKVYTYTSGKKSLVIKQIKNHLAADVHREVRALRHLEKNPFVVDLHFVYKDNLYTYLVLEHLQNGCVHDFHKKVSEQELKIATKQMLTCIHACHRAGVIHGDIKLTNFAQSASGITKLIDFGCSSFYTSTYIPMECHKATWFYAAPEQFLRTQYTTSDMYSLGVCVYYLATGRHPVFDSWVQTPGYSNSYTDFIKRLLRSEPCMRLTSHEALIHPWLCER
ncbi:serine/threonine-protein kinase [bacterium]|nr:serine/threonine-protein kinase [bacterium]NDC94440.1 serine/threonine-protein kinase [bacterium]NDG29869.1 serine/threonine-protein kinase [bacterium]